MPGMRVGHATAAGGETGCTVVLGPFRAAVEVRGLATGTRELGPLDPHHLVPQAHGIAIYELVDHDGDGSHFLGVLNRASMGPGLEPTAPERPYGNLIPIPGRGLVSVSATTVAFWKKR